MKFVYEYKTSANERRSGVLAAASKDAAYKSLKAQGIRPYRVTLAPGALNRLAALGHHGWAIVILAAIAAILTFSLLKVERRLSDTEAAVFRADRHQIYGDPTLVEEWERAAYTNVFDHAGERLLAYFAQPGRDVTLPIDLQRDPAVLQDAAVHEIVHGPNDPREVAELKHIVNGMKVELRAFLKEATPRDYLKCLYDRQREEAQIYERVRNELSESNDPALWEARNHALRELGIMTVPRRQKKSENTPLTR